MTTRHRCSWLVQTERTTVYCPQTVSCMYPLKFVTFPSPLLSCPPLSDEADVVKNILFVPDMTDENHQQTSARRRSDFMWKTAGFGWKCFQMSLKKISSDVTPTPVVCLASFLICNNTITSTSPCERQLISSNVNVIRHQVDLGRICGLRKCSVNIRARRLGCKIYDVRLFWWKLLNHPLWRVSADRAGKVRKYWEMFCSGLFYSQLHRTGAERPCVRVECIWSSTNQKNRVDLLSARNTTHRAHGRGFNEPSLIIRDYISCHNQDNWQVNISARFAS